MSGVRDVSKFHGMTLEQLDNFSTRHLLAIMTSARSIITCGCHYHCGDEYLDESDRAWNENQRQLTLRVKGVLSNRPHVERDTKQHPKREKKVMRY